MFGRSALFATASAGLLSISAAQSATNGSVITTDSPFYGQSPPTYPAPEVRRDGLFAESVAKARALVATMTLEEKVNLTGGVTNPGNGCGGNIPAVPSIGFPGMCLQDGPAGVRGTDFVSGFAAGIHTGASWNRTLAYSRANAMGGEAYRKGVSVALGPPVVGPLGRIAEGGRNWEGFSNDPYLSGALAAESVHGIQDAGVIACTKHFIANEQETNRIATRDGNKTYQSSSTNMDDKTLYLWPFADTVHAGTGSVMCSYERFNNSYVCQNSKLINGVLKTELGFEGFVVTDWFAQHSGVASSLAGLDMTMPSGATYWAGNLTQAVRNGSVPEARIDDQATRILAAWYELGLDSDSSPGVGVGMAPDLLAPHTIVDARDAADAEVILGEAIEGHVLVKNVNNALPLKEPRAIALYGYDAKAPDYNAPSPGLSPWSISLQSTDATSPICGFYGLVASACPPFPINAPNGSIWVGGGSGGNTPTYFYSPFQAFSERAFQDGTQLLWDFENVNATSTVYGNTEACFVFINAMASEGIDRSGLHDDFSDSLVNNIADQCSNTTVVVHNAGIALVDAYYDHPNVTAIILAQLPGQDSGRALVDIVYGEISPSGKLTYTVAKNESDYGAILSPYRPSAQDAIYPQDDFSEGVYIDYRAFDAQNIEPRFEFGFGLTYTNFTYSNLRISANSSATLSQYPTDGIIPGGHADLWDVVYNVYADVKNTGEAIAAEIAQLYLGLPGDGQPIRQLRGFDKQWLNVGETVTMGFPLRRRDLSTWSVEAQQWELAPGGTYKVYVGASSRNLPLTGSFTLGKSGNGTAGGYWK
ncbi:hypothetical protein B0A48_04971 [Cryoendolithus antarcticus]|uniref:beta-glucosidase n=1 Tax=Cryoendolithus antarcticus TaxID=1507870 RepID=A0A1V8TDW5_9PEZI|nr:hypothetical protein B0A48_04971 [Cryoendolithus antarcticus]